jgi:hypothetical protein
MRRARLALCWITSSARAGSEAGSSRRAPGGPELITSSNLFACSTGRSAGLTPFKILSVNCRAAACRRYPRYRNQPRPGIGPEVIRREADLRR